MEVATLKIKTDYSWKNNPEVEKFLDVVSSIIATEFIEVAKKNPDAFKEGELD